MASGQFCPANGESNFHYRGHKLQDRSTWWTKWPKMWLCEKEWCIGMFPIFVPLNHFMSLMMMAWHGWWLVRSQITLQSALKIWGIQFKLPILERVSDLLLLLLLVFVFLPLINILRPSSLKRQKCDKKWPCRFVGGEFPHPHRLLHSPVGISQPSQSDLLTSHPRIHEKVISIWQGISVLGVLGWLKYYI